MTMICCRKMIHSKVNKGKSTWGEVWRKPEASFQMSSSHGDKQNALKFFQHRIVTTHMRCLPRKLTRDSGPKFLLGAGQLALSAQHITKFQIPEGKQVFSINHIVCAV